MICAECSEATTSKKTCSRCGVSPLLGGRYSLDAVISRGSNGITYVGRRLADDLKVCINKLAFHRLAPLEAERLFRREAAVLRRLEHPKIPAYVDDLVTGSGRGLGLYLVQAFVDGHDLQAELAQHAYSETEVLDVVDELLGILDYLHMRTPPVVHRDIKPSNVMRRRSDGALVLVGFGAIQHMERDEDGRPSAGTVAGTYGYMAPEQFLGQVDSRSDVYAVGAMALALATQSDPAALTGAGATRHTLQWQRVVAPNSRLGQFLAETLPTEPYARPANAGAARTLVAQLQKGRPAKTGRPSDSAASEVDYRTVGSIRIVKPDALRHTPKSNAGWFALVGGVLLLSGVAGAMVMSSSVSSSAPASTPASALTSTPASAPAPPARMCGPNPCLSFDTTIIGGLRFGMTMQQALTAIPALRHRLPLGTPSARNARGTVGQDRLDATVTMAGTNTACSIYFPPMQGLSEINCSLLMTEQHEAVEARAMNMLVNRYGPPTYDGSAGANRNLGYAVVWKWADDQALLTLESSDWTRTQFGGANVDLKQTINQQVTREHGARR